MTDISKRAPTHRLYILRDEGASAKWIENGVAWPNSDGQGYALSLDALPVDGKLMMRTPSPKAVANSLN